MCIHYYIESAIHRIQYESKGGMKAKTNEPLLMIWPIDIQHSMESKTNLSVERMDGKRERKKRLKNELKGKNG